MCNRDGCLFMIVAAGSGQKWMIDVLMVLQDLTLIKLLATHRDVTPNTKS